MTLPASAAAALDELARFGTRLGLERMHRLLAALGDPHAELPAVLVAGTNGKGSVSALLAAIGQAGHYRTGLYTSPHLECVEERLRLDGEPVSGERLGALIERVLAAAADALDEPPTYFEVLTACAFLWLAEEKVELAVLEVGLGGRLDATNVVRPVLSVVTPIGLDHAEHLGTTLAAIAREKAGVLRSGVPAVLCATPAEEGDEAGEALAAAAAELGAEPVTVPAVEAVQRFAAFGEEPRRQRVWLREDDGERTVFELALAGRHQAENLALAVAAARALAAAGWQRFTPLRIARGVAACRWPGRLEEVTLPDGTRLLLDVAHNPAAAAILADYLRTLGAPVDLLFGVLEDKDAAGMLERLLPALAPADRVDAADAADAAAGGPARVTFTTTPGPRGRAADQLMELSERTGVAAVERQVDEDPARALAAAAAHARAAGRVLVVAGSLVLVGAVRTELRRRFGVPAAAGAPATAAAAGE